MTKETTGGDLVKWRKQRLPSKPPGGLVAAALWVVGGVDGERDPLELYGGGDEGFVGGQVVAIARSRATVTLRGVVSRWRAVSSLRWPGVGHLFRMELSAALEEPTQAKPGLEWATDPPREEMKIKVVRRGF